MTTTNGMLLVDKPRGLTSHDVVARVRRILRVKRVGHAGTLDPMATGLLVLAVGPSTRLLRFAQSSAKRYEGEVTFGVATDSLDADGQVIERREVPALRAEDVAREAAGMLGAQTQVPPMVSALKVGGRRLHALARQGVVVEREPRAIEVFDFTLEPTEDPARWRFAVSCSVGTYVRVLASDLAACLGTIAHLSALRRVASGDWRVEQAVTLEQLDERASEGHFELGAPSELVASLDAIVVDEDDERRLREGQRLRAEGPLGGEVAALDRAGNLVAIVERRGDLWQPTLVMPSFVDGRAG